MRITVLDHGHRTTARLFLAVVARLSQVASPDIVKMLLYRPEFLSGALLDFTVPVMRGPSHWTAGEREYLAHATAKRHRCPFCIETHAEMTRLASGGGFEPSPDLTAVLTFVENPTTVPALPAAAVRDALHVVVVWDIVNRLANAFGFELRAGQLESGTRALHRLGYRFPRFLVPRGPSGRSPEQLVAALRQAVLSSPAHTSPATREAAAFGGPLPEPLGTYAETVRTASYRLTDADVDRCLAAYEPDEIFEVTVAAAVGAALRALDTALSAVEKQG